MNEETKKELMNLLQICIMEDWDTERRNEEINRILQSRRKNN